MSAPGSRPGGRTFALLAAIAILALAWAIFQVPGPLRTADVAASPAPASVPGFRADAWFLPDDPSWGFVEIPEGLFLMGSDPRDSLAYVNEHWADGSGPASVHLPTFLIGRYEVTVAQFRAFAEATGHPGAAEALRGAPDHPVVNVSWPDALAYARWLEARLRESPSTPAALAQRLRDGWRLTLPTEAQWEKAARGSDGRVFPWGDQPREDRANFAGTGTVPVGSYPCPECPFPLSDMSGNAWEWTRTPFVDGPHDPSKRQIDLEADALWVMRGGSFGDPARNVRAALRGGADPGVRRPFIGFRLVLSP